MKTLAEILYDYMKLNGVDDGVAWEAAQNCARATAGQAMAGAAAGAGGAAGLMVIGAVTPPTEAAAMSWTIMAGVLGTAGGAYHAIATSPSCHEVRAAASALASFGN